MPVASELRDGRPDPLDGREETPHHPEVGIDEALAVEGDEPRVGGQWHLAHLDQQRRHPCRHLGVGQLQRLHVDAHARAGVARARYGDPADVVPVDQATRGLELRTQQDARGEDSSRADRSDGERPADHVASGGRTHGSIIRVDRRRLGNYIEEPARPSMYTGCSGGLPSSQ